MSVMAKMMALAGFLGGGISVPETAEVGQTIVVKAVDENGKPTEWEAVDALGMRKIWEFELTEAVAEMYAPIDETAWAQIQKAGAMAISYELPDLTIREEPYLTTNLKLAIQPGGIGWAEGCIATMNNVLPNHATYCGPIKGTVFYHTIDQTYVAVHKAYWKNGTGGFSETAWANINLIKDPAYTKGGLAATSANTEIPIHAGSKFAIYVA